MMRSKLSRYVYMCGISIIFLNACSTHLDVDTSQREQESDNVIGSARLIAQDPTAIKGVKWKQAPVGFLEDEIDWWLEKPDSITLRQVVQALKSNGVNAVVIRVDDISRFKGSGETQKQNHDKAMNEIAKAVGILNEEGLGAYLWARIWLERDGKAINGSADAAVTAVYDRFKPVLNKIKTNNQLDAVNGLALIEVNCDRMADIRTFSKKIADKFNAEANWKSGTNGFFKSRSFFMPGAGFGLDFRGVNDSTFLSDMQNKCQYFSFIYKYMKADHESVTKGDYDNVVLSDGKTYNWSDMEKNNTSFTVALRKEFLNKFNVTGLVNYLTQSKSDRANHVLFWGDKWDGLSQTPPLSRQALYELLVQNKTNVRTETKAKFFCMTTVQNETAVDALKYLSYLKWDLTVNNTPGRSAGMTIGKEWQQWGTTATPGY